MSATALVTIEGWDEKLARSKDLADWRIVIDDKNIRTADLVTLARRYCSENIVTLLIASRDLSRDQMMDLANRCDYSLPVIWQIFTQLYKRDDRSCAMLYEIRAKLQENDLPSVWHKIVGANFFTNEELMAIARRHKKAFLWIIVVEWLVKTFATGAELLACGFMANLVDVWLKVLDSKRLTEENAKEVAARINSFQLTRLVL